MFLKNSRCRKSSSLMIFLKEPNSLSSKELVFKDRQQTRNFIDGLGNNPIWNFTNQKKINTSACWALNEHSTYWACIFTIVVKIFEILKGISRGKEAIWVSWLIAKFTWLYGLPLTTKDTFVDQDIACLPALIIVIR